MLAASGTVTQVASNNGGGTRYPPPINSNTVPAPFGGLKHMGNVVLDSPYSVQNSYVCKMHNKSVSDTEISSLISDLQEA